MTIKKIVVKNYKLLQDVPSFRLSTADHVSTTPLVAGDIVRAGI